MAFTDVLTTVSLTGTGTFDVLMQTLKLHLDREFERNRITGAEYAKAYIALTQTALQVAMQYALQKEQSDAQKILLDEQIEATRAQTMNTRRDGTVITGSAGKQKDLLSQQIVSYKTKDNIDLSKLFSDAWTVQKSVDDATTPPANYTNAQIDVVLDYIRSEVGFPART